MSSYVYPYPCDESKLVKYYKESESIQEEIPEFTVEGYPVVA
jgi:hypothetical protein